MGTLPAISSALAVPTRSG